MPQQHIHGAYIIVGMLIEHPLTGVCRVVAVSKDGKNVLLTVVYPDNNEQEQFTVSYQTPIHVVEMPTPDTLA